jgi:excisionase family DNA binding protein
MASVREAAEYYGITQRAVLKRLNAGTLPGEKVGGRWHVDLDSRTEHEPNRNQTEPTRTEPEPSRTQHERIRTEQEPQEPEREPETSVLADLLREKDAALATALIEIGRLQNQVEQLRQLTPPVENQREPIGTEHEPKRTWFSRLLRRS